uniref:DUF148 domain-containing protein n=1 Tax=Meloidogyne hapla TaxID=6305 RepID=A0A1I8B6L8_MELHA
MLLIKLILFSLFISPLDSSGFDLENEINEFLLKNNNLNENIEDSSFSPFEYCFRKSFPFIEEKINKIINYFREIVNNNENNLKELINNPKEKFQQIERINGFDSVQKEIGSENNKKRITLSFIIKEMHVRENYSRRILIKMKENNSE